MSLAQKRIPLIAGLNLEPFGSVTDSPSVMPTPSTSGLGSRGFGATGWHHFIELDPFGSTTIALSDRRGS